jgi:hypothetical protein
MTENKCARVADREEDYVRLGLKRGQIEPWEDGMRTTGGPDSYEWWYFDAHLDDGTSLVITFCTKWVFRPKGPLAPLIIVDLNTPGQPAKNLRITAKPEEFSASKEKCDVKIKDNYFRGDLHKYQIRVADQGLSIDIELVGQVAAWRHGTGHTYFGEHNDHLFGWLPSVPQGKVVATITEKDFKPRNLTGIGYHDHNWGDVAMSKLVNHWYWGRGQAGPYSLITSYLYAEKAYEQAELPVFMLAKDGKLVADDSSKVKLHLEDEFTDENSKKPVANRVIFEYKEDDQNLYRVAFQRSETILDFKFADQATGFKHILARLLRVDGAYLRFNGVVSIERYVGDKMVERSSDPGIWELMYFGHVN